jgi:hypothetical protein
MIEKVGAAMFYERSNTDFGIAIRNGLRDHPRAVGVVYFENRQFDSSEFGAGSVIFVGADNTFKSVEDCEGKWINDLPSRRKYPQFWCSREDIFKGHNEAVRE